MVKSVRFPLNPNIAPQAAGTEQQKRLDCATEEAAQVGRVQRRFLRG